MCIFLMNATACRYDIQIDTVKTQITVIREIRLYPAEGHMPRASKAPFALVDIVRCLKLWTTVDAGRCSQCSPTNGSPGRRRLDVPQAITRKGKKTYVDEQLRIAPQKPNRRTPRARFSGGRGFRRHLLSRYSVHAEVRDGKDRGLRRYGFSRERLWKMGSGLTEDYGYMAATGRKKGSGESQKTEKRKRKVR